MVDYKIILFKNIRKIAIVFMLLLLLLYVYWCVGVLKTDIYLEFFDCIPPETIKLEGNLVSKIKSAIVLPPIWSVNTSIPSQSKINLTINGELFVVYEQSIVYKSNWGTKEWGIKNIRVELEKYGNSNIPLLEFKRKNYENDMKKHAQDQVNELK
jgi:hypothetical protein